MAMTERSSGERAQSAPVGFALILGLTIVGATVTLALGGVAFTEIKGDATAEQAESGLTQLDSAASRVALGGSSVATVDVGITRGAVGVEEGAGWFRIASVSATTRTVLVNRTMGAVVYDGASHSVAYQGGGVWRAGGDGRMVSPPELHYRGSTLTVPLVRVRGDAVGDRLTLSDGGTTTVYPTPGQPNPLADGKVVLTVRSDYYRGWATFFEDRTGGNVTVFDGNETVRVELVVPLDTPGIQGALASGTSVDLDNNVDIDGYNSSEGPYPTSDGDGTLVVEGDLNIGGNHNITGDVIASGSVDFGHPNAHIDGNVSFGDSIDPHQNNDVDDHVGGWAAPNASLEKPSPIGGLIDEKKLRYASDNDSAGAADVSSRSLQNCGSTCVVPSGDYYLSEIDLDSGDTLRFDTSGGPVQVYVEGGVDMSGATIEVRGGNDRAVRIYNDGSLSMTSGATVDIPGDRSPRFWLYMNSDSAADMDGNSVFRGVLYGPGDEDDPGVDIDIENNVEVFGALVGAADDMDNNPTIHYDEALSNERPVKKDESIPRVTYLHVTVNEVEIEN